MTGVRRMNARVCPLGQVCDPNSGNCVSECSNDGDYYALNFADWYECKGTLLCEPK